MAALAALAVAFLAGYVFGSIPFGLILTRLAGLGDVRRIGSGNIGATNVLRTGNRALAVLTLLLDVSKGAAPVLLAGMLAAPGHGGDARLAAAAGAVIGHMFPVWLRFRGGKGVATALGVLLAISWAAGLVGLGVWLLVALLFRYSSLAALVSTATAPAYVLYFAGPTAAWFVAGLALLIWARHRDNIRRLIDGTEGRVGPG